MLNHAFLIIAHDSPELLERIVDNLIAPNHYFFVHLDKSANRVAFSRLEKKVIFIDSIIVNHGGFSLLMSELLLLKSAISYSVKFDYFHLISGHDYPCQNMHEFDAFFEYNCGKSFMHFDTEEQHKLWDDRIKKRCTRWFLTDANQSYLVSKLTSFFLNRFFAKIVPMELFAGWQWFSWHRRVVEYVLCMINDNPTYLEYFRYSSCCDEIVFHTLLNDKCELLNIDRDNSLRYIDWFPKRKYNSLPLVLDERDYDNIKSSGAFFCRKVFLENSDKLLSLLDSDLKEK